MRKKHTRGMVNNAEWNSRTSRNRKKASVAKASIARVEEDPELDQEFHFYFNCDWYPLEVLKMEWKVGDLIQLTF